eukprot:CAMPEP_0203922738 /NCGR_PEP_ID=MMETSP0359-20131031/62729_1 /ASSEMBLY_ACC=CAM_ASM_000338 /TAXON_ID=268821 /ORGANISM="Scrippsiella Hangoei, Strain SHTV-5" /LENGTH=481 /DNA_ID=CAMNT_0050850685 /DNA_START=38 /DNA_END=1480 /DNA_ORIENTATION=+
MASAATAGQAGSPTAAELRHVYPHSPSARLKEARASGGKRGGAAAGAGVGLGRPLGAAPSRLVAPAGEQSLKGLIQRPPFASGAYLFPRAECPVSTEFFSGKASDLQPTGGHRSTILGHIDGVRRCQEVIAGDLPGDDLAPLPLEFAASAEHCKRAGRFALASALTERLSHLGLEPAVAPAATLRAQSAPPLAGGGAAEAAAQPGDAGAAAAGAQAYPGAASRPRSAGAASAGLGCMFDGCAADVCANCCGAGGRERSLRLRRGAHWHAAAAALGARGRGHAAEGGGERDEALRLRRRWPAAFAVGPSTALVQRPLSSRYFEVAVDFGAAAKEHLVSRVQTAAGAGQRPLLQVGLTSSSPPRRQGADEANVGVPDDLALEEDFLHEGCWLIGMGGHVFEGSELRCTVPVEWPCSLDGKGREQTAFAVRPGRRLHVGLAVEASGALRLLIDGAEVACAPEGTVPRPIALGGGRLHPVVVLGP